METDESDSSENEIPDLGSSKPYEFEPKTNIDDEEEGTQSKVKRIGSSEWCECSKPCKPKKTYTESLCCREGNDISERSVFLEIESIHLRFSKHP